MSEFGDLVPVLALIVTIISASFAILTYLRVSRKQYSKALAFQRNLEPKEETTIFRIKGIGTLQKIEIEAKGNTEAIIIAKVDGEEFLNDSFNRLSSKRSEYIKMFIAPYATSNGYAVLDVNLQKIFYKNIEMSIKTIDQALSIKGILHYNIYQKKFSVK